MLRKLEDFHNWLSDTKFVWFPFLFLKPDPATPMRMPRTLVMTLVFGLYYNAYYQLFSFFTDQPITRQDVVQDQLYWWFGFLIWFNGLTAPVWNLRATRSGR